MLSAKSRKRSSFDRLLGVGFILFLLWLGHQQMTGQLGDRWTAFVGWLGQFFG